MWQNSLKNQYFQKILFIKGNSRALAGNYMLGFVNFSAD